MTKTFRKTTKAATDVLFWIVRWLKKYGLEQEYIVYHSKHMFSVRLKK